MKNTNLSLSLKLQQGLQSTPYKVKIQDHTSQKYQKSTNDKSRHPSQEKGGKKCITKRAWTYYEDELLKELVQLNNYKNWSGISNRFNNRGGKQCRERWYNHLRQGINKEQWSKYEEWILALGVRAFGNKWSKISHYLPGRTDNTIKNRWNCKMNPKKFLFEAKLEDILSKGNIFFSNLTQLEQQLLTIILQKNEMVQQKQISDETQELIQTCRSAILNFYRIKSDLGQSQDKEQQWIKYLSPKN